METYLRDKYIVNNKSFIAFAIFLWILIGFSYGSADYFMYESYFERVAGGVEVKSVESGYIFLNWIAKEIGLKYSGFVAVYSFIAILLIASTLNRYAKFPKLVLLAYFCYPFFLDVTQMRHFMVSAILIFSIRYLENYSLKNLLKYCACILIASTQQITAFIYFFLILAYLPSLNFLKKVCVSFAVVLSFFIHIIPKSGLYIAIIGLREGNKDYDAGMYGAQLYLYVAFFVSLVLLATVLRRKTSYYNFQNDFLYKICLISLLFIPFLLLDFQYTRFFRGFIIIVYIYLTNVLGSQKNQQNRLAYLIFFMFALFAVGLKLFGPSSGYYNLLTYPILNNNYFFEFLF